MIDCSNHKLLECVTEAVGTSGKRVGVLVSRPFDAAVAREPGTAAAQ